MGAPKSLQTVTTVMKLNKLPPCKESYDQPRRPMKKQRHYIVNKGLLSESYGFFQSICMDVRRLSDKELMPLKCGVGEDSQDCKEIKPVNPKEIKPEYSLEVLMLKLKLQYLTTCCKELTHGKDPDAGKDRRLEEKGMTEDEMVGWYHSMDVSLSMLREMVKDMNPDVLLHGVTKSWTLLSN